MGLIFFHLSFTKPTTPPAISVALSQPFDANSLVFDQNSFNLGVILLHLSFTQPTTPPANFLTLSQPFDANSLVFTQTSPQVFPDFSKSLVKSFITAIIPTTTAIIGQKANNSPVAAAITAGSATAAIIVSFATRSPVNTRKAPPRNLPTFCKISLSFLFSLKATLILSANSPIFPITFPSTVIIGAKVVASNAPKAPFIFSRVVIIPFASIISVSDIPFASIS